NAFSSFLCGFGWCTLLLKEFNFHPLKGRWLALQRGPFSFAAMEAEHQSITHKVGGPWFTRTGAVSKLKQPVPYQNRIKTTRVELSGDVGRAKADAPTC